MPLYVFCGEQMLAAYLRPAKKDAALHAVPTLKLLVGRLREAWPGSRILFRGDPGFCRPLLMGWYERNGVDYVIGLAKNQRLHALSAIWCDAAETAFEETGLPNATSASLPIGPVRGRASGASSSRPNTTSWGPTRASWLQPWETRRKSSTSAATAGGARWKTKFRWRLT